MSDADALRIKLQAVPVLDAALAAAGVAPSFHAAVRALFLERKFERVGSAVLIDGETVASVVADWARSNEGRAFLGPADAAPAKRGAPASKKRSEMSTAEKGSYIGRHGLDAFEKLPR